MLLPLANLMHHKLRSLLAALGVGIGLCMLVTLTGLARGSLFEVTDRWESVDADLIIYPAAWGNNITTLSGIAISDRLRETIPEKFPSLTTRITPVFLWPLKLGGQDNLTAGVRAEELGTLTGNRPFKEGRSFAPKVPWDQFIAGGRARRIKGLSQSEAEQLAIEPTETELTEAGYLELVIDSRLAAAGKYSVGQSIQAANHTWKIVGIVEAGGITRAYLPHKTAQFLFGSGDTSRSTLLFAKLADGQDPDTAARTISTLPGTTAVKLSQYRQMLTSKFSMMLVYVDAVNVVALLIAFLFVMTTLYMTVIQRTREIAILKSFGASRLSLTGLLLGESLLLATLGLVIGLGLSAVAAWAISQYKPLLTVEITPKWILLGAAAAVAGAILAAILPAYRATKIDMTEALNYE